MKKLLKIAAFITAIALIAFLLIFTNAFCGNPLSKHLAQKAADAYVKENYSHLDVYVDEVGYSFKTSGYYARVKSSTSIDTVFVIDIDSLGHITSDGYDSYVTSGHNTANRLDSEYRELSRSILESPAFPYSYDFGGGSLYFLYSEYDNIEYDFGMYMTELEIDKLYDVRELGSQIGVLTVYIRDNDLSVNRAAEMILTIKKLFDDAGIPFKLIDFNLRPHINGDTPISDEGIYAEILYNDIYEDGMADRVQAAYEAKKAYYDELDAMK